ncbi:MAG: glutamate---cysteine ligase / carboxylate-amine ligase [Mycobacterium sp.]|nr:glutamate---cysteine ligase / carboxylate-amine ligase [Mycobacterium sp.]
MSIPLIGVEEEYFLVDPRSWTPRPAGAQVVATARETLTDRVCGEFTQYQVEVNTPPCADVKALRANLFGLRTAAAAAAAASGGLRIYASGTPVVAGCAPGAVGDHPRYRAAVQQYRTMLDDFAICAVHVHVHQPDAEVAVLVGNHLRPWLPLLVALSANSPFDQGRDTGYASWRAVIRSRFPCLGPPPYVASVSHQRQLAEAMAESEAMLDADTPYWDIRFNTRWSTLEIRSMDVNADIDDTVALAVLVRAMVVVAAARVEAGDPGPRPCSELLRAAYWRAARDGWSGSGIDAMSGRIMPAAVQVRRLVDFVKPVLQAYGEFDLVTAFVRRLQARGGGAERQRASAMRNGVLISVVDDLVNRTAAVRH